MPGRSEACVGLGGCIGGQQCKVDGSGYDLCVCGTPGGGGGSTGGGTGGGSTGGGGGALLCVPGQSIACVGPGGCASAQVCNPQGSGYEACVCAGGDDGGGLDDGGLDDGGSRDGGSIPDGGFVPDGGFMQDGGSMDAGRDGGPDLSVTPATTLDLGSIAYFAAANPASYGASRITIRNVGVRPQPPNPLYNLRFAGPPYWEVTPLGGAMLNEICVGVFNDATNACTNALPSTYDNTVGLVADGVSVLDLPVRITPNGLGTRSFQIRLFTNDPDQPTYTVTVTGNAVTLPPCDIEVSPITLDFGAVFPPASKELAMSIRNRLTGPNDTCAVSNLRLLPETGRPSTLPPIFSLTDASNFTLAPGETRQIRVRAAVLGMLPQQQTSVSGTLSFNLADPIMSVRSVALSATLATPCLVITPSSTDFGTLARNCNSANRTFQIFNICATQAVITSATMGHAAGEGPGGPNCPGTAPCPEFVTVTGITSNTVVSAGGTTPVTFTTRYRPINDGADLGAFVINVSQNGRALSYVVPLSGRGNLTGLNSDVTAVPSTTKADVLLVIDDSGSMGDKQTALAMNMTSFLDYATMNAVDFQLGITNTELDGTTASLAGTLHASSGGTKILRPATPNFGVVFRDLVDVGTTGYSESCMDPATRFFSPANIVDPAKNAGFLREDAMLSVVCLTDARDQAPLAPATYLARLQAIKNDRRRFTYNVMGPFAPMSPAGCSYDDPNDARHDFMVSNTNGVKEEICTPNWGLALEKMGKIAFGGNRGTFYLTTAPDLSSGTAVEVRVNGTPIPAMDPVRGSSNWTFDAVSNAVVFEPLSIPAAGTTVELRYTAPCVP